MNIIQDLGDYAAVSDYDFLCTNSRHRIATVVRTKTSFDDLLRVRVDNYDRLFLQHDGKWYLVPTHNDYAHIPPADRIPDAKTLGPFDDLKEPMTIYVYLGGS
jgi:hypothetical protein